MEKAKRHERFISGRFHVSLGEDTYAFVYASAETKQGVENLFDGMKILCDKEAARVGKKIRGERIKDVRKIEDYDTNLFYWFKHIRYIVWPEGYPEEEIDKIMKGMNTENKGLGGL